ncbi:MAG: phosphopantothenoylcysteine decarboxylase [Planctomycetaceae bacterium]|jgi:phosphopantothenoylcysteine decarboxylase/phosphopantothenate--cysteine ligase|nr:phosphopantothenoylcysteine decarboxylase [Planctomycetaceae bacterium]
MQNGTLGDSGRGVEILVGVTGSIAAYKAAIIVSQLRQRGYGVSVVMTAAATELVGQATFEALSGRPVRTSLFRTDLVHTHIELARSADLFCIAPATANILSKAAAGIADDLVSTLILSFDKPILFAPAMNPSMWLKPVIQNNVKKLIEFGSTIIYPETGRTSCGETGVGRMASPETIITAIVNAIESKHLPAKKTR